MPGRAFHIDVHTTTHMHTCVHIHTYAHAYMHAYMHICTHAHMHACMHACMHAYIHTCIHEYTHTCIHPYIHSCMHAYNRYTHVETKKKCRARCEPHACFILDCNPSIACRPQPVAAGSRELLQSPIAHREKLAGVGGVGVLGQLGSRCWPDRDRPKIPMARG